MTTEGCTQEEINGFFLTTNRAQSHGSERQHNPVQPNDNHRGPSTVHLLAELRRGKQLRKCESPTSPHSHTYV